MNRFISLMVLLLASSNAYAQELSNNKLLESEKWWGLAPSLSNDMPYTYNSKVSEDSKFDVNLTTGTLVSSQGRYIYSPSFFDFSISEDGVIGLSEELVINKPGATLREAVLSMSQSYFRDKKSLSDTLSLSATVLYVKGNSGQDNVIKIVNKFSNIAHKRVVFSYLWQEQNGALEFSENLYPQPASLISSLKESGSEVFLTVTPYVSGDSELFHEFKSKGYLVLDNNHKHPKVAQWSGGFSAMLDLSKPEVVEVFVSSLERLKKEYEIDGFVFASSKIDSYRSDSNLVTSKQYLEVLNSIASKFDGSIAESVMDGQNLPLHAKLRDIDYQWSDLEDVLAEVIIANLLGYHDILIGANTNHSADELLQVRLTQMQAFMPTFSLPANLDSFSQEGRDACLEALSINNKLSAYFTELIKESVKTGAPLIRHMEYEFPAKAFYDCDDQFMLGSKYLVAPILNSEGKRMVRLPSGRWKGFDGTTYKGPRVISINCKSGDIPYFELSDDIVSKLKNLLFKN
ncbi:MAG: glycoside hydrolase family 31 protein [Rikenellaceae bacterium]